MDDAKALVKENLRAKPAGVTRSVRFYVTEFGAWNQFALKAEFENVAECQGLFAEWNANLSPEFRKEFQELRDHGGSNEIWTLLE